MSDILSSDNCFKILQNYFKEENVKCVNFQLLPLSEDAEGFMGEHYKLHITYRKNGTEDKVSFFLKTKPRKNKLQADIVAQSPIYQKEIFIYEFLFKEFEKYGYDTSFAAKSYFCIPNDTLVMDDLSLQNYKLPPRHQKFSLEEIKHLLKSLAMYHGAGFAYQQVKSKELGRKFQLGEEYPNELKELFYYLYIDELYASHDKFWKGNFTMLDKLIDELPKEENFKNEFKSLIKEAKLCSTFAQNINLPKTCGHGDLWSNNMMFNYENNIVKSCRLLDFQVTRWNCPSIDIILAIFSNTSSELRKKHLEDLYQYYYKTLTDILQKYGFNISEIMTLDEYHQSIALLKHEALTQVIVVNAVVFIPKGTLTESVKKDDDSFDKLIYDKTDMCIEAFKNNPIFKEVMLESLYDLYDALVAKLRS